METIIDLTVAFTVFIIFLILGAVVLSLCAFLYDYLKKEQEVRNEKRKT